MPNPPGSTPRVKSAEGAAVRTASAIIILSFMIAVLYLGRTVLEPLALAVLLAFVMMPPIRRLRRWGVGKVTSVIAVVIFALAFIGAFGVLMETEMTRLAGEIPRYQGNLRQKVDSVNNALVPTGALKRASATLNDLAAELKGKSPKSGSDQSELGGGRTPVPVEVQTPQPATLGYLENLIGPFVTPLTMAGLLVLFLVFILFYREDLRDRILRLAGTGDLHRTTEAMNEAGQRLSRFFLIQSAINGAFGFCIFLGLWAIGVPNPALWGILAAILRFVPYIGTPIAAIFPLLLAAAIEPGWAKVIETAGLFFVLELITGQAIEPVLQGQQTGLSPVAIIISQLFWTLIWGPPGLLLAVPITVCIAVLGRHVEALTFLGVVVGDEPALAPHEAFYQRLLAGDATEATAQAEGLLTKEPLSDYYDTVPMAALALAQADAVEGKLSKEKQLELNNTIAEIFEDLDDYSDETHPAAGAKTGGTGEQPQDASQHPVTVPPRESHPILLVAARSAIDQSACLLLADILKKQGLEPAIEPYPAGRLRKDYKPAAGNARLLCVSYFGASQSPAPVRYLIRSWRRILPEARVFACFWFFDGDAAKLEELRKNVGADFAAASLKEAAGICSREASSASGTPVTTGEKSEPRMEPLQAAE